MEPQGETTEIITPEMIGHAFVSQFYSILHKSPELVHRFFQDTSIMTRPARDGSLTTVRTMKDINDLMLSLDCDECKAEILTADAQASHRDGVIVLVTGCLTGKDNVRRKFTEMFFLAPQSNGYYVLNDAFRFVGEDEMQAATSVEVKESDENVLASTFVQEPELVEVSDRSLPDISPAVEPVSNGNVDVCNKPDEQLTVTEPVVSEPPVELLNHIDDQVVMEPCSDKQDGPKKSYASIVKVLKDKKESARTTPNHAPSITKKNAPTPNSNHSRGTVTSVPKPQANGTAPPSEQQLKEAENSTPLPVSSAPNGNTTHGNDVTKTEEKGYSIYIGNLPYDATVEHVEEEFKKFGPIKHGGIQVRCNKASLILIGGYEAFIEEKKTSTRVVNGVPTFSGGRGGGYRNDGFRGRGNFSGGRGYGRNNNDYGRRGGDYGNGGGARNGDGYHRGYPNGGGRTVRQQQQQQQGVSK
ncbi:hypothetical protein V2J09_012945 [Rumex salicifolius]